MATKPVTAATFTLAPGYSLPANGGTSDPNKLLDLIKSLFDQRVPQPKMQDINAPTSLTSYTPPNTNGLPSGTQTYGPSPYDQVQTDQTEFQKQQLLAQQDIEQKRAAAVAKHAASFAELVKTHPSEQFQLPEMPSLPVRQQAPIPERGQVNPNPWVMGLAALSGLFSPRNAGHAGAAVLEGAANSTNQQYQDQLQKYQLSQQQLAQNYQDEMNAHNETSRQKLLGAQTAYENANAMRSDALNVGNADIASQSALDSLNSLPGSQAQQDKTFQSGVTAQGSANKLANILATNKAGVDAYDKSQKTMAERNKTLAPLLGKLYDTMTSGDVTPAMRFKMMSELNYLGQTQKGNLDYLGKSIAGDKEVAGIKAGGVAGQWDVKSIMSAIKTLDTQIAAGMKSAGTAYNAQMAATHKAPNDADRIAYQNSAVKALMLRQQDYRQQLDDIRKGKAPGTPPPADKPVGQNQLDPRIHDLRLGGR